MVLYKFLTSKTDNYGIVRFSPPNNSPTLVSVLTILEVVFGVFIFCPALAVTVRRLHDRNHSG
ncbi:MAG: DUF805 domain-containing protein [Turicimonas muris]